MHLLSDREHFTFSYMEILHSAFLLARDTSGLRELAGKSQLSLIKWFRRDLHNQEGVWLYHAQHLSLVSSKAHPRDGTTGGSLTT